MKRFIIGLIFFMLFCGCNKDSQKGDSKIYSYLKIAENDTVNFSRRINCAKLAFEDLRSNKNSSDNRKMLIDVAWDFLILNQWDDLKLSAEIVLKKSIVSKDSVHMAYSYEALGLYFMNKNKNDSAMYYYLKSKKIYEKKRRYRLPKVYLNIGGIYVQSSDMANAEATYFKALKEARIYGRKYEEFSALLEIAIIANVLHEYDKSIEYNIKAKAIGERYFGNRVYAEICLNNIGHNYYSSGNYKKALEYYKESLKRLKNCNRFPEFYALLLDNIANANMKLHDFNNVPELYYQATKIRDSFNVSRGRNANRLFLSNYFTLKKDTVKAIAFAKGALALSKECKAPLDVLDCLKDLALIDNKNAPDYSKQYIEISDSLQLVERQNRNKFARIAYETEELSTEKETAIKQKWIVLGIALSALILGILIFIIKVQRTKQKELIYIHEQQKMDESIYQHIRDEQIKVDEGRQTEKQRIASELRDGAMAKLTKARQHLLILNEKRDKETIEKCLEYVDDIQGVEKEIRKIAHGLNSEIFSGNRSFNFILTSLFNEYRAISATKIYDEINPIVNWEIIDNNLKMNLYQILQEILDNCNKHANARNIFITFSRSKRELFLHIHDDGNGFNVEKTKKRTGLKNILRRTDSLNGKITIYSRVGEGTTFHIIFPINKII